MFATTLKPPSAAAKMAVPSDIEKALAGGFFGYLTKPIEVSLFMNTLDAALKNSQTAAAGAAMREPV